MSRTYRNKKSVPHGWTVRDDGRFYLNGNDLFGKTRRMTNPFFRYPKFRRSWYRKESKVSRKNWQRRYRAMTQASLAHERWEDILPFLRTGGWLTW